MKRLSVLLIVAVATGPSVGCRLPGRGGPCAATRRPIIAPWARKWTNPQPDAVVVPAPAYSNVYSTYSSGCGSPMVATPGCGSPGVLVPGTTVYDSDVPIYDAVPMPGSGITTQPIPPPVTGPEAGVPGG